MSTPYGEIAAARHSGHLGPNSHPPSSQRRPTDEYSLQPAQARAVLHADDTTPAQRAHNAAQHCANHVVAYAKQHEKAIHDPRYSNAGIADHMQSLYETDAYRDARATTAAVVRNAENAEIVARGIRDALVQPGDAASEMRAQRAWDRAQRKLDATPETQRINAINALIENASDGELSMLVEELPDYMEQHNMAGDDATAMLDDALGRRVPSYGVARRVAAKAAQSAIIARHDLRALEQFIGRVRPAADSQYHPVPLVRYDAQFDPDAR